MDQPLPMAPTQGIAEQPGGSRPALALPFPSLGLHVSRNPLLSWGRGCWGISLQGQHSGTGWDLPPCSVMCRPGGFAAGGRVTQGCCILREPGGK